MASAPLETILQEIAVPTLIVWGANDKIIHVGAARILHGILPDLRLRTMPGLGHLPMLEDAAGMAEDYVAFRTSIGNEETTRPVDTEMASPLSLSQSR